MKRKTKKTKKSKSRRFPSRYYLMGYRLGKTFLTYRLMESKVKA